MLSDLIMNLLAAEKEKAYTQLERVGMDRMTAGIVAAEMGRGVKKDGFQNRTEGNN